MSTNIPLLNELAKISGLQLQDLEIACGKAGSRYQLNLRYQPDFASLQILLAAQGFQLPDSTPVWVNAKIDLVLAYQKRKEAPQKYALIARLKINGPIDAKNIFGDAQLPFLPTLDRLELEFEMGKTKDELGAQAPTTKKGTFRFYFTPNKGGEQLLLKGLFGKTTSNGNTTSILSGQLCSVSGDNLLQLNLGADFPNMLGLQQVYLSKLNQKTARGSNIPFALLEAQLNSNFNFDMGQLPIAGEFLKSQQFGFEKITLNYSTKELSSADLTQLSSALTAIGADLLIKGSSVSGVQKKLISEGLGIQGILNLGALGGSIPLNSRKPQKRTKNQQRQSYAAVPIGKKMGPVYLQTLSVQLKSGKISFNIDALLVLGPFTFCFVGLEVASPLNEFKPNFNLKGIGLNYSAPQLQLEGDFLHNKDHNNHHQYSGLLKLGLKKLKILGLGVYAKDEAGNASFFAYSFLNYPIGGPPVFFVTGLAAAVGINRQLIIPKANEVRNFPLVDLVFKNSARTSPLPIPNPQSNMQVLAQMQDFIPITEGSYFVGFGVRFSTFKIIDSFALLLLKLTPIVEVDIIGVSRYVAPSPQTPNPSVIIEVGYVGTYRPDEGQILLQGQLTPNSFIFSRDCHLNGGFAYGAWTSGTHEGDFFYCYGGFGKRFKTADHYPTHVPELELNWRINNNLSVKGSGYWALMPQRLIAGGHFRATFNSGSLSAWFDLNADFLIRWEPFHYEAFLHINLGVSYEVNFLFIHKRITVNVSADMHISGPEFSGDTAIDLGIFVFHIHFGAPPTKPGPICWEKFKNSFLPEKDQWFQLNIINGLVNKVEKEGVEYWIVQPKHFEVEVNSVVPPSELEVDIEGKKQKIESNPKLSSTGIAPMDIKTGEYDSCLSVKVIGEEGQSGEALEASHILSNSPKAVWGNGLGAAEEQDALIANTRKGIRLKAKPPSNEEYFLIDRDELTWQWNIENDSYSWKTIAAFNCEERKSTLSFSKVAPEVNERRNAILSELGFSDLATFNHDVSFTQEIQVGTNQL